MDRRKEEDSEVTLLELLSLERQLMEMHHELHMKRRLLKDSHKEVEEAVLKQHQLEHMLDQQRRDSEAMRLQLEVAMGALQQCGEVKNGSQAEISRLRVEKGMCTKERDSLKQQCHTLKLETVTLSRRIEELQAQVHCQQLYQQRCSEQEMKVAATMEKLKTDIQALEEDKKRLEKSYSTVEEVIGKLKESHNLSTHLLQRYADGQKKYEALIVELRAQVSSLKLEKKTRNIIGDKEEIENEDKTNEYLRELKEYLAAEPKENNKLTNAFEKSLEAQAILEKQERDAREKLQAQLQEDLKLKESNIILKKELEELQESYRKLQEKVKELELRRAADDKGKIDFKHEGLQTEEDTVPDVTSSSPENENPAKDNVMQQAVSRDTLVEVV